MTSDQTVRQLIEAERDSLLKAVGDGVARMKATPSFPSDDELDHNCILDIRACLLDRLLALNATDTQLLLAYIMNSGTGPD
jgi:hypothetical protein